jgi:hypothetical protein
MKTLERGKTKNERALRNSGLKKYILFYLKAPMLLI